MLILINIIRVRKKKFKYKVTGKVTETGMVRRCWMQFMGCLNDEIQYFKRIKSTNHFFYQKKKKNK